MIDVTRSSKDRAIAEALFMLEQHGEAVLTNWQYCLTYRQRYGDTMETVKQAISNLFDELQSKK